MNTTEGTPKAEIVSTPRDLFNHIDELPDKVMDLLNSKDECDSYEDCNTLIAELNELGYTMDYDLDAVGYNLRKMEPTPQRVSKVITAVLHSLNRSVQRTALWMRLQKLRYSLINKVIR
jgi:hypothetical protein